MCFIIVAGRADQLREGGVELEWSGVEWEGNTDRLWAAAADWPAPTSYLWRLAASG